MWLIDRYNNFEELYVGKEDFDEVVKMQILLQRIKGDEKENRTFIDAIEMPGTYVRPLVEPNAKDGLPRQPSPEPEPEEDVVLVPTEPSPEPPEIEDMEDDDEDVVILLNDEDEEEQDNDLY